VIVSRDGLPGDTLRVDVLGHVPVPRRRGSITQAEIEWRQRIRHEILIALNQLGSTPLANAPWLTLTLRFFLPTMATDVDNLPKPVLDTLFRPGVDNPNRDHLSEVTAVMFPKRDDNIVRELYIIKELAPGPASVGLEITLTAWEEGGHRS
jgi:hypothetical protein